MGAGCSRGTAKESPKDNGSNGMENLLLSDHQLSHQQQRDLKANLSQQRNRKVPSRHRLQQASSTSLEEVTQHNNVNSVQAPYHQQPRAQSPPRHHSQQTRPNANTTRRAQWEQSGSHSGSGSTSCGSSEATSPASSPQYAHQYQVQPQPMVNQQQQQQLPRAKSKNVCCAACTRARMEWDKYKPSPLLKDYAAVTTQNSKHRSYMEDECVAIPKFRAFHGDRASCSFFGVYDGHGGGFCSKYAAENFHKRFSRIMNQQLRDKVIAQDEMQDVKQGPSDQVHDSDLSDGEYEQDMKDRCWSAESTTTPGSAANIITKTTRTSAPAPVPEAPDSETDADSPLRPEKEDPPKELASVSCEDIEACFADAYAQIDREICQDEQAAACGTTAVTCLVRRYHDRTVLHVANIGDSRAIYYSGGRTARLSVDHKAINKDEVKRIRGNQGIIVNKRVAGVVSVTRAFGQADEKKFIISTPHVVSCEVDSDDAFLVLVSDGICDVYTDEELTEFVHERLTKDEKSVTICKDLLDQAKERGAMDNMTAVVICFAQQQRHPQQPEACRA